MIWRRQNPLRFDMYAETPFGQYEIDSKTRTHDRLYHVYGNGSFIGKSSSMTGAKQIAETDYNERLVYAKRKQA